MSLNITGINETKMTVEILNYNENIFDFIIKTNLEQNIFFKLDFLNTCLKNKKTLDYIFNYIKKTCYTDNNIIQLFINDKNFNICSNNKLADTIIKIFDNFNYKYFFIMIDNIIKNYYIKSQYLDIDIVTDPEYKNKQLYLLNLTYFLIEIFNKKFKNNIYHTYKNLILDKLIYIIDLGVINLYEELYNRLEELREIKDIISENNLTNINYFLLVNESRELVKRELFIKTLLDSIFPCVSDFVDYLINNFYYIKNKDIYNIIFTYKKNNEFIYKNVNNFINFSKLVMQYTLCKNSIFVINYTNFYIDLCFKYSKNNIYIEKISNKIFIEILLESCNKISKTDNFIYIYLSNVCKIINNIKDKNILERIDTSILKLFIYNILNNFNNFYDHFYRINNNCEFNHFIDFLNHINPKLLVSFELRNIYIEKILFLLENIFDQQLFMFNDKNCKKINNMILNLFNSNYNSILNYFSYEVNEFNDKLWNKFINHFKHKNYLILNFSNTVKKQLEFNKNNCNYKIDPICSNIIEEPVFLPYSDIIMDKYIIYRCLMDNEINPFNRNKLTIKELQIYNKYQVLNKK